LIYTKQGKHEEAIPYYRKAIAADPRDVKSLSNSAAPTAPSSNMTRPSAISNRRSRSTPTMNSQIKTWDRTSWNCIENQEAIPYLKRALRKNPNNIGACFTLGTAYQNLRAV